MTAISTIGWTAAAPFRRGECGPDVTEGERAARCFFFTSSTEGRAWDLARFNARYRLTGRWTDESVNLRDWQRDAGIHPGEMPPGAGDARFPVFEVERFCVIDVDRVAENIDVIHRGDDTARARDRAWLHEHRCDRSGPG